MSFNLSRMDIDPGVYIRFFALLASSFACGFMFGGYFGTHTATNAYQEKVDKGLVRYYDKLNGQWLWKEQTASGN